MLHKQLHKRLSNEQVKNVLAQYQTKEIKAKQAQVYLDIGSTRFYEIFNKYQEDPESFNLEYPRHSANRKIDPAIEENILKELKLEKEKIIDNPAVPTKRYNYSYIQQLLADKHQQSVALSTIIDRAKLHGYWKPKPPKKIHDREIFTNYAGELVQHDASTHLFAPDAKQKWVLISSLDDYSRVVLYADFWSHESTWAHIVAFQDVVTCFGLPLSYYADSHSIFRFVKDRDKNSPWVTYTQHTDDVKTQWHQVLDQCGVKYIPALSAQAKGKVERPFSWMQDHLVRTCVRRGIKNITEGRKLLEQEIHDYNTKRVHSTTEEIPIIRFRKALQENKTLFKPFRVSPPHRSIKDIFCLRIKRTIDAYRKVSLKGLEFKVPKGTPRQEIELRLYPDFATGLTEVRFWHNDYFLGYQRVKNSDLPIVRF